MATHRDPQDYAPFKTLSREQWLTVVALAIAYAVSAFSYFHFGINTVEFYFALLTSTTAALMADRFSRIAAENKVQHILKDFDPRKEDLTYIGDGVAAIAWFATHNSGLTSADNTVYRPRDAKHAYVNEHLQPFLNAIRFALSDECSWRDLYFHDEEVVSSNFYESLTESQRSRYFDRVLKQRVPLFQLMVLRYASEPNAVLFGWGFDGGRTARVYLSRDTDTVTYFEDYFEALYRAGEPISHVK